MLVGGERERTNQVAKFIYWLIFLIWRETKIGVTQCRDIIVEGICFIQLALSVILLQYRKSKVFLLFRRKKAKKSVWPLRNRSGSNR